MRRTELLLVAILIAACSTSPTPTLPPIAEASLAPTLMPWPTYAATSTPAPSFSPQPSSTLVVGETPLPTLTPDPISCGDLDAVWGSWQAALQVLDRLQAAGRTCGDTTLASKRYAAHINYAIALEETRDQVGAIVQYQAALLVNGHGAEALDALIRLDALPAPTEPPCAPEPLDPYSPSAQSFVSIQGTQFLADDVTYYVRGVNYYPRAAAWNQFLTNSDLDQIAQELDLIADAGLNTLRIFLWYDPLFTCAPESATPNAAMFVKLDSIIHMAAERKLRLIVTLNDLPDLLFRPLYTDYARYDAQTAFIVNRYKDEPAIMLWDLRNEGDIDYGLHPSFPKKFEQQVVLDWLAHIAELVRGIDGRHPLTAGWWNGALATADIVDVLSFHHWSNAIELSQQIAWLQARSSKPVLIEEVGYSSERRDEAFQARALGNALETADQKGIAGWLVWTAFDFVSPTGQTQGIQHAYGLWNTDLTPKPALSALPSFNIPTP